MNIIHNGKLIVTVKTAEVLAILKVNRERHAQIATEARAGYVEKAKAALAQRLEAFESGKAPSLSFDLHKPIDCVAEYDTVIKMLELHQCDVLELDGAQVRCFVQDQWEWTNRFYTSNSRYSGSAAAALVGSAIEED